MKTWLSTAAWVTFVRWCSIFLCHIALSHLALSPLAFSQDREQVERGKSATALVDLNEGERTGTAFCISASGLFVTNAHVVEGVGSDETITLVIDAGLKTQRKVAATIVRSDGKSDLAILKAKVPGEYPRLGFAANDAAFETMPVTAFGFPFGKGLALEEGNYPTASVNVGRVTALRREKGELQLLQVDVQLNPGNSGGPVLNEKGEVIGIVSFGVAGSGVNFLIPVEKLKTLLTQPIIEAQVPEFTAENLHLPKRVEVKLVSLQEDLPEPTVEFWLRKGTSKPQSFALTASDPGRFGGLVALTDPEAGAARLRCRIEFSSGAIEGTVGSSAVQIDGKGFQLSEITRLEFNNGAAVATFADGFTKKGQVTGLEQVPLDLGGYTVNVNLGKANQVELESTTTSESVNYIIIVKSKGKEIHRISSIGASDAGSESPELESNAARSLDRTIRPYSGEKKRIPMPGPITDVIQARGGLYLALVMKQQKKIAILDLTNQSIAKILPLSSDDVLVAGTLRHLVIVDRTRGVIERWALDGFKRQAAVKSPFSGVIKSITAGHSADGPILVHKADGTEQLSQAGFAVLDLMKLKEIPMQSQRTGNFSSFRDDVHVRASAMGGVFGMWCTSHSPQGVQTLLVTEKDLLAKYEHDSAGHIAPSADGMHLMTGFKGVLTTGLKAIHSGANRPMPCVPTSHPRFYISIPADPAAQINLGGEPFKGVKAGIHEIGTEAPLLNLPELDLGENKTENRGWSANDFTIDKRVYYVMPANLLVSVPFDDTSVVVQSFDFRKELAAADIDFFFISSVPNRLFQAGKTYTYQVSVESKKKGVKFELSSGPPGMKISPQGKLTWAVPAKFEQDTADIIVSVSNGSEQQTYDTFTIYKLK